VGNPKPHKNLRLLAELAPALPYPVALAAGRGVKEQLCFPASSIELPSISEEEMPLFYAGAIALLLPSKYEGFGFPALEAMSCGCPVIAARAGSLPEVTGEAGLLLPPEDVGAWREAALRLLRDEALRRDLVEKGRQRARRFSWEECARQTLAVYERVL
jgi:glycosyltransferase involved in cell wall biosynthesis